MAELDIISTTTQQLRVMYDASTYAPFTVSSGGDLTIAPTGGDTALTGTLAVSGAATVGGTLGVTGAVTLTVALTAGNGGTGLSSYTAGDTTYASAATTITKLAIGAANTVYTSTGSAPQWSTSLTLGGTLAVTGAATFANNVTAANNVGFRGLNTGAAAFSMLKLNASNQVELGNTSQNILVSFFDTELGGARSGVVSVGASDSGGSGFRTLRVANASL